MVITVLAFTYTAVSMIFLLPFGMIAMLFYFLGLKKLMLQAVYRIAQGWALLLIKVTRNKVTVSGRENIPSEGGVCFVCNHDGYFDIVLLLAYSSRPVGFIAKRELMFIPCLNIWIYLVGGLFIDRGAIRKAVQTINKGVKRIESGGGISIFPEGHRSKGRGLLPFHPGSLKLATKAKAPIVPVAITGSYNVFEKNRRFQRSSLKITFCPPISTTDLSADDRKQALSDRIYAVISETLASHNAGNSAVMPQNKT